MKTVVLANDLAVSDIIDSCVYKEYTKLLESDIADYFLKGAVLVQVKCPGCGRRESKKDYVKMGMHYKQCSFCASHYVSPRPDRVTQMNFYEHSKACRFWRDQMDNLEDSRLYYLYGPRINWISELVDEFLPGALMMMDIGTKYSFLLKHIQEKQVFKQVGVFDPELFERANTLPENVVQGKQLDDFKGKVSACTAFEVIERAFDPKEVFARASFFCQPGGLLLLTTASCTGFEYQVLGEQAPNINPVNRMNLLSIEALKHMIESAGFEILELSTPGRLDVDIVKRTIESSELLDIDSFWKYVFKSGEEKTLDSLQNFLQENRLSSHVRIAARKK